MPRIPMPPKTNKIVMNTNGVISTHYQQAILDAQAIRDIAMEQAKAAMIEMMKVEQEKRKQTILTIENIDKIVGHKYSDWLDIVGVMEYDDRYEFTLVDNNGKQIEEILLHRKQTSDKRYIMEYNKHTLWVTKDRLSTIDGIIECMRNV